MKLENFKNQKAITLVALIITVIVLLILATVSISLVINSGIISKAEYATDLYAIEQLKEQLYLKSIENKEDSITGKLSDLNLNINQDLINKYDDILYAKDGKLYLSFIAAFPETDLYKNNKEKIEKLKDSLEINYESIKDFNKVINPYFDDELNGYERNKHFNSNSKAEVLNEKENNYLHLSIKQADTTAYIYQSLQASENYNSIIYIACKYRNNYQESEDGYIINNDIINIGRKGGGYDQNLLNKSKFINAYNEGWKKESGIRKIEEYHKNLNISIRFGGGSLNASSWEYDIDFDDIYAINLTEIFGAGNEPTKEQMDEIFNKF